MAYGYYAPFYRGAGFNPMQTPNIPQQMPIQNGGQMPDNQYMPQYQQPMQAASPIAQATNDMIWVLNESEATAYPVAPNNSVVLWDKSNPTIYVKSVNMQGVPSMRILDFTERNGETTSRTPVEHRCECGDKFVLKKDFAALEGEFERFKAMYEEDKAKPKAKTAKKINEEVAE